MLFFREKNIGRLSLREFQLDNDVAQLHQWTSQPYAEFWGLVDADEAEVRKTYAELMAGHTRVFLGFVNDQPGFLLELYQPAEDAVAQHYDVLPGDQGMHILIAPAKQKISGFTFDIFTFIMEFMFSDPAIQRIVVEPDVRNHKIHQLNQRAGFQHERVIDLGHKQACLAFCRRSQFEAAMALQQRNFPPRGYHAGMQTEPLAAVSSIHPESWQQVNRQHLSKAISELAHERMIEPKLVGEQQGRQHYLLVSDVDDVEYRFCAEIMQLNHWLMDTGSIRKYQQGEEKPLDSVQFMIEFHKTLNIADDMLPTYLEEITATLCSAAYKLENQTLTAEELTQADFQQVETSMTEGHPSFIANNGRIGFDAADFRTYAPESANPVALIWIAAHKSRAQFSACEDYDYKSLIAAEFDWTTRQQFDQQLSDKSLNPDDYILMPVHPWQWYNKLAIVYAPDIASQHLVCLGYGDDYYLAQQSIRTFFNISQPHKHYVKTALSVLNMGFMRGLSSYYMRTTPAINDWLNNLVIADDYLQQKNFSVLREVAAVGYSNPYFEHAEVKDSPYKKMLAGLWRENPTRLLQPGQRLMTMAALLHKDNDGKGVLPAMIRSSGLTIENWLSRYLDVYLTPLLHCYYQHDLVFMPHGENLILIYENNVPVKALMKDIGEEICLLNSDTQLPDDVKRISIRMPEEMETLSVFTDVFDGIFRYLSQILWQECEFSEQDFWRLVANCIQHYMADQQNNSRVTKKLAEHSLFIDEFAHSCLNRLQLGNNKQMVDLSDPGSSLKFAGTLVNPIACFAAQKHSPVDGII